MFVTEAPPGRPSFRTCSRQRQVGGSSTTVRAAANEMNHQTAPNAARQEDGLDP